MNTFLNKSHLNEMILIQKIPCNGCDFFPPFPYSYLEILFLRSGSKYSVNILEALLKKSDASLVKSLMMALQKGAASVVKVAQLSLHPWPETWSSLGKTETKEEKPVIPQVYVF